jgi:hypothetical protein
MGLSIFFSPLPSEGRRGSPRDKTPGFDSVQVKSVTVPVTLDHNRMLVEAEIQQKDGRWRKAILWVDTGNPNFYLSESLARDLGIDLSTAGKTANENVNPEVPPPAGIRIGGMRLNFEGVKSKVMFQPYWLFSTMHNDANLPSTVLKQYRIIFDYPKRQLTIARPGSLEPRGVRSSAGVNPQTGIVQMDAVIDGEKFSFALDNGASYSFASIEVLERFFKRHADWPRVTGTLGCANMWGWWPPDEQTLPVMRFPEILWGQTRLTEVGIVGVPRLAPDGPTLGAWYSQKAARPVDGFLGPNAFKAFRVEIDYANSTVYFEKGAEFDSRDMDTVGLTLQPQADGRYQVIGVTQKNGKPAVEGVEPGDKLLQIGDLKATGATMGAVADALRGQPGDVRILLLERNGRPFKIEAKVARFL